MSCNLTCHVKFCDNYSPNLHAFHVTCPATHFHNYPNNLRVTLWAPKGKKYRFPVNGSNFSPMELSKPLKEPQFSLWKINFQGKN